MRNTEETVDAVALKVIALLAVLLLLSATAVIAQPPAPPPDDAPDGALPLLVPGGQRSPDKWMIPPGLSLDARQRVQTFIAIQAEIHQTPAEKINWLQTLPELHAILADEADTLVSPIAQYRPGADLSDLQRISLKQAATQLITELPAAGRQRWLQLYADTAAARLQAAMADRDERALALVASQFVETPAGAQAAEQLGARSLDTQRPALAIHYLERLRQSPAARRDREPQLSLKIAAAWTLLQREDRAGLVLAELGTWLTETFPDDLAAAESPAQAAAIHAIRAMSKRELLASLRASMPGRLSVDDEPGDWTQPRGSVTNSMSVSQVAATGQTLWRSFTDGFSARPTAADRLPFATPWADYDEEPYPRTTAQMAGMVEVALEYLDRIDIEESRVGLPVSQPLIVGELAVLRTFDRVRAVDVHTGSVVWESFQQDPAFVEQFDLLTAKKALNFPRTEIRSPVNQAQEALLLARTRLDRTTGTLSSDGLRVYFVNGGGVASRATKLGMARLIEVIPKGSNTLRAIDLTTGRLEWEVGGESDTPRLPGAGRFFLGPPACLNDGLYVVAEDDGHAILLRLDPATGATLWQQELGEVISPTINEALRRITGEAPVVVDGLLVCTTSSGQVYAVARDEQRIVWMNTYPSNVPPARRFPVTMRTSSQPMNTDLQDDLNRWRETLAAASAGRLILSAVDSPVLNCLDIVTGEVLWKQPRGDGLFVASVHDDQVVLVGAYGIRSLDLLSGQTQWNVTFDRRVPAGRGVRSGDIYHLPISVIVPPSSLNSLTERDRPAEPDSNNSPLRSAAPSPMSDVGDTSEEADSRLPSIATLRGAILSLDLRTGRVLAESRVPDGLRLGNLAAADGRLVAQGFNSVVALESASELRTRLADQIARQPDAPSALLARARLRLHNGDRAGIEELLQGLSRLATLSAEPAGDPVRAELAGLRSDAEALLIGQILEMQKHGEALDQRLFDLLDEIELDAATLLTMQRVKTESLLKQREFAAAFEQLLALAETARDAAGEDGESPTLTDDGVTLPVPRWVTGRLAAAHRAAAAADDSAAQLALIENTIAARLNEAQQKSATERNAALSVWLDQFAWHASSNNVRLQLAASLAPKNVQAAERVLAPLLAADSLRSVAQAQAALASVYGSTGHVSAFYAASRRLSPMVRREELDIDTPLLDGRSLSELRIQWSALPAMQSARAAIRWPSVAPKETLDQEKPPTDQAPQRFLVERIGNASEPFDGLLLELSSEGLTAIDADGRSPWTIPSSEIPFLPAPGRQRFRAVWLAGGSLLALVINSDMAVFDSSFTPPKRLWSQSLIANDPAILPYGQKSFEFGAYVSTYRLRSGSRGLGAVDLLTPTTFVWRSNNRLHVVDARNGDLMWERPAPSGEGFVFGDDRLIVLAEVAPTQSRVFETTTGRLLATFDLPEGAYFLSASGSAPAVVTRRDDQFEVFGLDVLTGERRWQFANDRSMITLPFNEWLVTLHSQGRLQVRDVVDGTVVADLKVQPFERSLGGLQFHETPAGFVFFRFEPTAEFRFGVNRLSSATREHSPVNGYACGVDLQQQQVVWEGNVPASFLLKPQPRNLPVVLLASSQTRTDDGINLKKPRYELTAIDTRNGKPVTHLTTDEPFQSVAARRATTTEQSAPQVEISLTDSAQPVTITLKYEE